MTDTAYGTVDGRAFTFCWFIIIFILLVEVVLQLAFHIEFPDTVSGIISGGIWMCIFIWIMDMAIGWFSE